MIEPQAKQAVLDEEHLRLLALFHFVQGGLCAIISCVLIIHFAFGLIIAFAPHLLGPGPPPPHWLGVLMCGFAGGFMLAGWTFGGLTIYSGLCIRRRQHRTLSFVMAVLNCLSIPYGTALGVFTFIVLSRESVKRLYGL